MTQSDIGGLLSASGISTWIDLAGIRPLETWPPKQTVSAQIAAKDVQVANCASELLAYVIVFEKASNQTSSSFYV
jgi:hypothetical protein